MDIRKRGYSSWADLPQELLETIADGLGNKSDVSRLRSVCESWRLSAPPFKQPITFPLNIPYLGPITHSNAFSVLYQSTLYHLSSPSSSSPSLPNLVKLREQPGQRPTHALVDPLSSLPVNSIPKSFPRVIDSSKFRVFELAQTYSLQLSNGARCAYRVALSTSQGVVVALCVGVLWVLNLNPQERIWRVIDDMLSQLSYEDITLFGSRFCAVDEDGRAVELDARSLKSSEIARPLTGRRRGEKRLVVSGKDTLLLVDPYRKPQTAGLPDRIFRVYRLNSDERRWEELFSLGDRVVLLGDDGSFSFAAARGQGNCIIFRDPGFMVFDFENKKLFPLDHKPEYVKMFYPLVFGNVRFI